MKKTIPLFLLTAVATITLTNCNDDNNSSDNPIVGTWKVYEKYEDENYVTLSECEKKETFIFGDAQYSHETFTPNDNSLEKTVFFGDEEEEWAHRGDDDHQPGGDDDDNHGGDDDDHHGGDNDDHHGGDDDDHHGGDNDDHHGGDDDDHHGGDDDDNHGGGDDNGGGNNSGDCTTSTITVGHWQNQGTDYTLISSEKVVKTISVKFQKDNTEFFFEKSKKVNGTTKTVRYIFKKQ